MTTPAIRAALERLVSAYAACQGQYEDTWPSLLDEPMATATAALAQPEPQKPTESDVTELFYRNMGEGLQVGFENAIAEALARWGRPAIEPVPVSERLPGPEDCDAEGRCWFFHTSTIGGNEWFLNQLPKVSEWYRWQSITHWLPFHALPLPEGGAA